MENIDDRLDIKLPYGFTNSYLFTNLSNTGDVMQNQRCYCYDDNILWGTLIVLGESCPLSATVHLRKNTKFYFSCRNKLHYLKDSLDVQINKKISGESIHDIFDKFLVIRNNIILNNPDLIHFYINILPISSIEQIINKANSVQLDSIMEAITKSSEINGEYVAMCLKRKSDLGYTDPKKELFL